MQLRILGCSGGIGRGCGTTSFLLDDTILVDAGTGVGRLDVEELRKIDHVFLTHSHLDHVASLPLLLDTVFDARKTPVVVHAMPETIEAIKTHILNWTIWPDFAKLPDASRPVLTYEPLSPGESAVVEGKTFTRIWTDHVVPTAALCVTDGERLFCYSADTGSCDGFWNGLNELERLDLLLVECAFPDENAEIARLSKHYCPTPLAQDLEKLRHRPAVGITHLKPGAEDETWRQCEELIQGFELFRVQPGQLLTV